MVTEKVYLYWRMISQFSMPPNYKEASSMYQVVGWKDRSTDPVEKFEALQGDLK